ncbi:hypothetical protein NDU88_003330 [Pleurodeles waltl]|uniref:Uncharacterized protein n=1 Tax=Pleurodeles waltl TaxID=8319 RepID=A0AAV7TNQ2_PLEWA|nr:hypothetical protein NDU88_003330 [Pleurodeles waltl]
MSTAAKIAALFKKPRSSMGRQQPRPSRRLHAIEAQESGGKERLRRVQEEEPKRSRGEAEKGAWVLLAAEDRGPRIMTMSEEQHQAVGSGRVLAAIITEISRSLDHIRVSPEQLTTPGGFGHSSSRVELQRQCLSKVFLLLSSPNISSMMADLSKPSSWVRVRKHPAHYMDDCEATVAAVRGQIEKATERNKPESELDDDLEEPPIKRTVTQGPKGVRSTARVQRSIMGSVRNKANQGDNPSTPLESERTCERSIEDLEAYQSGMPRVSTVVATELLQEQWTVQEGEERIQFSEEVGIELDTMEGMCRFTKPKAEELQRDIEAKLAKKKVMLGESQQLLGRFNFANGGSQQKVIDSTYRLLGTRGSPGTQGVCRLQELENDDEAEDLEIVRVVIEVGLTFSSLEIFARTQDILLIV